MVLRSLNGTVIPIAIGIAIQKLKLALSIAQVHRLWRAIDHLELVIPQQFNLTETSGGGDRYVYANRTRVIPNRLLKYFESCNWPLVAPMQSQSNEGLGRIDLAERMRDRWH